MKQIWLVTEDVGHYDDAYTTAILAYDSEEKAQEMADTLNARMRADIKAGVHDMSYGATGYDVESVPLNATVQDMES